MRIVDFLMNLYVDYVDFLEGFLLNVIILCTFHFIVLQSYFSIKENVDSV